jgi:hypothetical protein
MDPFLLVHYAGMGIGEDAERYRDAMMVQFDLPGKSWLNDIGGCSTAQ